MAAQKEIWQWIEKYPNYSVSNFGNIRRRCWIAKRGKNMYVRGGALLKLWTNIFGYITTHLFDFDGKKTGRNYFVHRLVADAFIPNVEGKPFINHKNGIKNDNRVENLEWCTAVENQQHAVANGLYKNPKGNEHRMAKLNENQVIEIRKMYQNKEYSQSWIANIFGVSQGQINRIVKNISWSHIK